MAPLIMRLRWESCPCDGINAVAVTIPDILMPCVKLTGLLPSSPITFVTLISDIYYAATSWAIQITGSALGLCGTSTVPLPLFLI